MKKTIIFDLNGVFIISPKLSERLGQDFGVKIEDSVLALSEVMDTARKPNSASIYSLWMPYLKKWGIILTESEFLDYWFSAEKENTELVDIARKLKKEGYRLIIMSNNFRERAGHYDESYGFLKELFEKVYYSWQTGFVKPDIRAFELIFSDFSLKSKECVYFDDSERNIDLAKSIGIESYIFDEKSISYLKLLTTG